jgi:hypothetical protein
MRKFFSFATIAFAAFAIVACDKEENKVTPDDSGEDYKEIKLSCTVDLMEGIETANYATSEITMPGDKILEFFDMTAAEFYKAMGTFTGDAPATSQVDNTIQFGVCTGNDIEKMNFCPSSTNSFGCWMTAESAVCTWGDDAVFYHESVIDWGLEEPDQETLDYMWTFGIGFFPGHNEYKAGDKVKATYFFYKEAADDDEVDLYCYVEVIFNIVAPQEVSLTVVETKEIPYTVDFDSIYTHFDIDLPLDDIKAKIGLEDASAAKAYGVNADGSYSATTGTNFWFMTDGNIGGWGEGATICMNTETGVWRFCMMPDPAIAGTTATGAIAFYNDDDQAYIVRLNVTINALEE